MDIKLKGKDRMFFKLNEILNIDTTYACFVIIYIDPFISNSKIFKNDPICFTWIKRPTSLITSTITGNDEYYPFDLCQNESEVKILNSLHNFKNSTCDS